MNDNLAKLSPNKNDHGPTLRDWIVLKKYFVLGNEMWEDEFGYVGDGDRLRCLHGTPLFHYMNMHNYTFGSTQCSSCVVYGPSTMAGED